MAGYEATITWNGDALEGELADAALDGLEIAAEHLLQVSRGEVPLDEGTLERSGTTSLDERGMLAAVSFDTPYAVCQHEDMGLRHAADRKAKYLEDPMNQERATLVELVAASIRRRIARGH